jgi:choline dehydrogenase-like flavoprotein
MSIQDSAGIASNTEIRADICVIGSGAAGITLARLLNQTELDAVVLEAGGLERDLNAEGDAFAIDEVGIPPRNPIPSRGRWFGGSTNLWFGRIATPDPIDFEPRPWVPYSGWPITLSQLRPWFEEAARILDVPHFDKIEIDKWPSNPTIETFVTRGGANLDVFLWANGLSMGPRHRQLLKASRNVKVILNATATELIPNECSSSIESAVAHGPSGNRFLIKASDYVLAAGGLENPRLLLASTLRSPAGVGNPHDQVGRYYMDHPRSDGLAQISLAGLSSAQIRRLALLDEKTPTPYDKAQLRVTFPSSMQRQEHLLNHSLHAYLVSDHHDSIGYQSARRVWHRLKQKVVEPSTGIGEDIATTVRSGASLAVFGARWLAGRAAPTRLIVVDQMEQEPDPSSRVTVNPRQRDRFGLPRLERDWRIGEATYRSQRRMHEFFKDIVERAGIKTFTSEVLDRPECRPSLLDMKHPMGTTRMSSCARDGVVDTNCQVYGVDNLYVAGSSVFPTGGHSNPTLLIVALAARLASHLRKVAARPLNL